MCHKDMFYCIFSSADSPGLRYEHDDGGFSKCGGHDTDSNITPGHQSIFWGVNIMACMTHNVGFEHLERPSPVQADVCSMQDSSAELGHECHEGMHASLDQDAAVGVLQQQFPAYSQVPFQCGCSCLLYV